MQILLLAISLIPSFLFFFSSSAGLHFSVSEGPGDSGVFLNPLFLCFGQ